MMDSNDLAHIIYQLKIFLSGNAIVAFITYIVVQSVHVNYEGGKKNSCGREPAKYEESSLVNEGLGLLCFLSKEYAGSC